MIPLRLSVNNFMCYRDDVPPLHFESIHVACLCGDNGHGKTALLDAITWALWGIARATPTGTGTINALRIADLVHMGQTDMSVELDFTSGDQRYRVVRRHTVSTGGSSSRTTLELQIATGDESESFRSISRNSVRETNARISEILNMDFKTFVNTAYLAQGQADLFTTSTPTERKRCLAEVLDLSYYQRLSEDANARSRSIQTEIQQTLTAISLHSEETARKPEYESRLNDIDAYIANAAPQAEAQRKQVETLRGEGAATPGARIRVHCAPAANTVSPGRHHPSSTAGRRRRKAHRRIPSHNRRRASNPERLRITSNCTGRA